MGQRRATVGSPEGLPRALRAVGMRLLPFAEGLQADRNQEQEEGEKMSERTTHAYDRCPRCKSGQIEPDDTIHVEGKFAVEYLHCCNCFLYFEQRYQYVCTISEWDDEEEAC